MAPRTQHTFCRICEPTCGLTATVEGDRIISLEPDKDHVVSKGYACVKGLRYHEVHHSPDRLRFPLKRVGDRFVAISWEQALDEIGTKVRQLVHDHGGDAISAYLGNPISFSLMPPILTAAFLTGLGSKNLFQTGSQDCNNKFAAAERLYGFPFIQPFPDVDRTQCLIMLGSNPAVSRSSFMQLPDPIRRLRAIEQRGGRVYFVNPRRTETAKQLGTQVFIRPDTDIYFLLSFLHEVVKRDAIDHERVRGAMKGLDALRKISAPWSPERTSAITGISADTLRSMVDAYLQSDGAALFLSTGVNQGSHGTLAFWIQEAINAITGNLDRIGGTLVGHGYIKDFPKHARKGGHTLRKDLSRIGQLPSVADTFPAGIMADEILTPGEGQIRALFVVSGNPLLTVPNSNGRLEQALKSLELVVSIDIFRNETANLAHYILPGTSAMQRADLPFVFQSLMGAQPVPYAQFTDAVVPVEDEQRDETMILLQLARACGANLFGSRLAHGFFSTWMGLGRVPLVGKHLELTPERFLGLMARAFRLGSLRSLRKEPHGRLLEAHKGNDFLGKRVVNDDGLVDLAPTEFVAAAEKLESSFDRELVQRDKLKLISKREQHSHNSWLHNHPRFVEGRRSTNYLYMHPQDGEKVGVQSGEMVEVRSSVASVRLPVELTDEMMIGAVALPHGWGHQDADGLSVASQTTGANVNLLAADGPEQLEYFSGMAQLNGILVDVVPVAEE
ncbi:MAG: molybdopterin-dependent oxidoreductase [Myxococcales bacterium]|nr:molybdopterin-dependent oxidoreductase [Myxococcales bacterium]MDH3484988.1 molybdopterin-dependent oxidoreductase [Myxococcales bacterium]